MPLDNILGIGWDLYVVFPTTTKTATFFNVTDIKAVVLFV